MRVWATSVHAEWFPLGSPVFQYIFRLSVTPFSQHHNIRVGHHG